ncbi:MAG: ATP-binding protein [Candidatus Obscuribacterales bacterium]|nr:ATP-binding protein [Candidatus Obscuribacterales bacterium]
MKNVSVGSYIKIVKGFINIIGKVEGESIREEKYFNKEYNKEETKIDRTLQVSLFGHFENEVFKQGIKEMPLIDNECYVLDRAEFNALHQFYKRDAKTITIGGLTEEPSQKIKLSVNKIFASHIGIFGNTGSGKSNTLARIYTELFSNHNNGDFKTRSKFVIIDFNGEYGTADVITKDKDVYELSTGSIKTGANKYPVTRESIRKLEVLSVLLEATEKTQTPFLSRALANRFFDDDSRFNINAITNIQTIFNDVINKKGDKFFGGTGYLLELCRDLISLVEVDSEGSNPIDSLKGLIETNLGYNSTTLDYYWDESSTKTYDGSQPIYEVHFKPIVDTIIFSNDEFSKIKLRIVLNYYHEIIKGFSNQEHIRPLIGRMFKKLNMLQKLVVVDDTLSSTAVNNLTVISLRDVNVEMKKVLPLIICKQLYDEKKIDEDRNKSLHIIIDEAHNILSTSSQRESETWKDYRLETFEEIIKEGRKFGTFLTIASQRPYDISATIISQLHNYFIHRLINDNDIQAVSKTVAYLDKLSFQTIPILSVGSCFVAGLASDLPVKVDIDLLEKNRQPASETIDLEKDWKL